MVSTYLLRASDEQMAAWKQAAAECGPLDEDGIPEGIPFSDWLRRAADSYLSPRSNGEHDGHPPAQPQETADSGRSAVSVTPDPKVKA